MWSMTTGEAGGFQLRAHVVDVQAEDAVGPLDVAHGHGFHVAFFVIGVLPASSTSGR